MTESGNPDLSDLDQLSTLELAAAMNAQDSLVPTAIAAAVPLIAEIIDQIAERMEQGGRLIYVGAGTPGRLGVLDASECPPTFGVTPETVLGIIAGGDFALRNAVENAEDDADAGKNDLTELKLGPLDSVVGVSASGRTPYVLGALDAASARGALTIGFSCNAHSPLGQQANFALDIEVGPELVAGSTRLKAGTTQKLVLNMISTITMIRLGKTYRNLMVDLQATNAKLRARSERTVIQATGADPQAAQSALTAASGSVKVAILMILAGFSATEAVNVLAQNHDRLSQALHAE